jgi:membrane peptidoglycan carboxypeptidase
MVGYVLPGQNRDKNPGLATAVWVGNKKEEVALKKGNDNVFGSTVAAPTFRKFMAASIKGTTPGALPKEMVPIGHKDGNGIEPTKAPDPTETGGNGPGGPGNGSPSPSISTRPGNGGGGGGGFPFPPTTPPRRP